MKIWRNKRENGQVMSYMHYTRQGSLFSGSFGQFGAAALWEQRTIGEAGRDCAADRSLRRDWLRGRPGSGSRSPSAAGSD